MSARTAHAAAKARAMADEYFEWLYDIVCKDRFADTISYKKLLMHLHSTDFRWSRTLDADRAGWGIDMRYRFAQSRPLNVECYDVRKCLGGPCTVLEMMIALAVRCEEDMMDDESYGDRTAQWFWNMVRSLGLGAMNDRVYDPIRAEQVIQRFLNREYEPNGNGGLFTLRHAPFDARDVDIWYQLCWYLDERAGDVPYRIT